MVGISFYFHIFHTRYILFGKFLAVICFGRVAVYFVYLETFFVTILCLVRADKKRPATACTGYLGLLVCFYKKEYPTGVTLLDRQIDDGAV